ncbi:MAG TPA: HlyD family secretion protein [Candidatus Binataceae bacterium]|nr:HlyD family secretion protein [Candidatus Binataceae bacterium]
MNSQLMRRIVMAIVALVIIAAALPAWRYYVYLGHHITTDDAYVDGTVALVSSRVAGTVAAVYVEENWTVKEGEQLLELDPRDFEVRVKQAGAQLERARQSIDELAAGVNAAKAGVALADSQLTQAQIDFDRAKLLKKEGIVSAEQYDQATTGLRIAMADVALAKHQLTQAEAALGPQVGPDHSPYDRPVVEQANAALDAAKLDLAYTKISAPFSGVVTHKSVHAGQRVQPGEPLMAIVPMTKLYVTANFKETQLTDVRVGQPAEIEADIYPGATFRGHVDSISMGTGSAFALLPAENATGNWVKVVQRVPVKISLDSEIPANQPLRLGLSVEVSIDTADRTGPLLTSMVQHSFERGGQTLPNERLTVPPVPIENSHEIGAAPPNGEQHTIQEIAPAPNSPR